MNQVADKVARKKSKASSTPSTKPKIKPSNKQKAKKCKQASTRCAHCSVMYGDLIREEEITGCNAWGARRGSMRPVQK